MSDKVNNYIEETKPLFRLLRTEAFRFIIIRYNHYSLVNQLKKDLLQHFPERPQNTVDARHTDYRSLVDSYYKAEKGFFFIENFDEILANPEIYSGLNQRRDKLALFPIALFVFISSSTEELFARQIMEKMPDLWSFRSLMLDLKMETNQLTQSENLSSFIITPELLGSSNSTLGGNTPEEKELELKRLMKRIEIVPNTEYNLLRSAYEQITKLFESLGNHNLAIEYYLKLEAIEIEIGDKIGLSTTYNNIGLIYSQMGNFDQSMEYYIKSEKIRFELGDKGALGTTYNNIGGIHSENGNYEEALKYYINAEKMFLASGYKEGLGAAYNNIAGYYIDKKDWGKALEYLLKSEKFRSSVGDKSGLGATYYNLGFVYSEIGDLNKALESYIKAEKILFEVGDIEKQRLIFLLIAKIFSDRGDWSKAIDYYQKLSEIEQKVDNKKGIGEALNYMGIASSNMGDFNKALVFHHQAESIRYEIGDDSGLIQTLYNIGMEWLRIKNAEKAVDYFTLSGYIANKKGMDFELNQMDWAIREIIRKHGKDEFMKMGKKHYESWLAHFKAERKH